MDDTIRTAELRISHLASDEETWLRNEAREKALHDRATWLKDAREKGMEQGFEEVMFKTATAYNMLNKGTNVSEIMKNTGLTIDQIEKINARRLDLI